MNHFPMRGSADRVGRDSSFCKPALGMTRRDLDAHAVFGAVEHAIVARVAVALIRSATGEALFAKFVAEIERAGDYAETDAGPHKHQKWTPNAEVHTSSFLRCLRSYRSYDLKPSRVHRGHNSRMPLLAPCLPNYLLSGGYQSEATASEEPFSAEALRYQQT